MITFRQYRLLDQGSQAELLWLDGVYLNLIRETANQNIELYSLYHFYVEIFFDKSSGEPLYLQAFENQKELEPYLSLIDIDGIFQAG
jgi:hypothetical protein